MATQTERTVVYGAGIVQGIALVTFPAASAMLTDPAECDLSNTQYGALFIPQVITAIAAALLGTGYGIAAFGVGPLLDSGVALPTVHVAAAIVAVCMGLWSLVVTGHRPSPTHLDPQRR